MAKINFQGIDTAEGLREYAEKRWSNLAASLVDAKESKALYAACSTFIEYCETMMLAESHIEDPEGWTAPTGEKLTVEEARQEGERLKEDCESILAVARSLWYASEYGYSGLK